MTTITALPTPPSRSDPTNFAARGDAFNGALPVFVTETNLVAGEVNTNATTAASAALNAENSKIAAANSAAAAALSVNAAAAAAGATKWVSGTSYSEGQVVWSPISFFNYRRKIAGAGTTDPSLDQTNWALMGSPYSAPQQRISANTNAVSGIHYLLDPPAAGLDVPYTVNLGSSPTDGETRQFTNNSTIRTIKLDPQGKKIRGLTGIMNVDDLAFSRILVFNASLDSWV